MVEIEHELEVKVEDALANPLKNMVLTSTTRMKEVPKIDVEDVTTITRMENKIAKQLGKNVAYVRNLAIFKLVASRRGQRIRLR